MGESPGFVKDGRAAWFVMPKSDCCLKCFSSNDKPRKVIKLTKLMHT